MNYIFITMPSVFMLNVIILIVAAPFTLYIRAALRTIERFFQIYLRKKISESYESALTLF